MTSPLLILGVTQPLLKGLPETLGEEVSRFVIDVSVVVDLASFFHHRFAYKQ